MSGIIRFIFAIIWFAIGLSMAGSLKNCTKIIAAEAISAHQNQGISFGKWNRRLNNSK